MFYNYVQLYTCPMVAQLSNKDMTPKNSWTIIMLADDSQKEYCKYMSMCNHEGLVFLFAMAMCCIVIRSSVM